MERDVLSYKTNIWFLYTVFFFSFFLSCAKWFIPFREGLEFTSWQHDLHHVVNSPPSSRPVIPADLSLCLTSKLCPHLNHSSTLTSSRPFCFFFLFFAALCSFFGSLLSQQLHVYLFGQCCVKVRRLLSMPRSDGQCPGVEKNVLGFEFLSRIKDRGSLVVKGKVSVGQPAFSHQTVIRKQSNVMWDSVKANSGS